MVKTLEIAFEYHGYPVWLLDERGQVVDQALPDELEDDAELDAKFSNLQARYDALFINTIHVFDYVGFKDPKEEARFLSDCKAAIRELTEKTKGRYEIVDRIVIYPFNPDAETDMPEE